MARAVQTNPIEAIEAPEITVEGIADNINLSPEFRPVVWDDLSDDIQHEIVDDINEGLSEVADYPDSWEQIDDEWARYTLQDTGLWTDPITEILIQNGVTEGEANQLDVSIRAAAVRATQVRQDDELTACERNIEARIADIDNQ